MDTAAEVIKAGLQEILVQASEAPIEPDEAQDAVRYLNGLMFAWAAEGIQLGYTKITSLGDDITIPDGALMGVYKNLGLIMSTQFGGTITQELITSASQFKDIARKLSISVGPSFFPGTLPVGSGNEGDDQLWSDHFYDDPNEGILTEQGGFIATESETVIP